MEAGEGAAALSPVGERQGDAAGSEPPLSNTPEGAASARKRCPHRREGHPYEIFFRAPVIGRVATRSSNAPGDRPCSGSVPTPAATPWNGFWSGSDAGAKDARARPGREPGGRRPCLSADKSPPRSSGHIALGLSVSLSSACAQQGEEGGVRPLKLAPCRSLFFFDQGERCGAGISSTRASLRATEGGPTRT